MSTTDFAPKPSATSGGMAIAGQRLSVGAGVVSFSAFNPLTTLVIVDVQGADVYVTFDGRTPSASAGAQLYAGNGYAWNSYTAMAAKFTQQSAGATVDAHEFVSLLGATQMPLTDVLKPKPGYNSGSFTNLTASGTLSVTGASTLTGNVTVGTQSTSAVNNGIQINGSSASGNGPFITLFASTNELGFIGSQNVLSGATNNLSIWSANAQTFYTGSGTLALTLDTSQNATFAGTIKTIGGATFHTTSTSLSNGAGSSAGTLTTAPSVGNPTKWIGINDNGTTRYIPAW